MLWCCKNGGNIMIDSWALLRMIGWETLIPNVKRGQHLYVRYFSSFLEGNEEASSILNQFAGFNLHKILVCSTNNWDAKRIGKQYYLLWMGLHLPIYIWALHGMLMPASCSIQKEMYLHFMTLKKNIFQNNLLSKWVNLQPQELYL